MSESELKTVPPSELVYPERLFDRAKYYLWTLASPYHNWWRDTFLRLRILSHGGRQRFLFGVIHPEKTARDFIDFLVREGYRRHHIAWRDDDELISLRKLEGFTHQYHIRIFRDGEVRAHYEYTPEYRPLLHYRAVGQEAKPDYFRNLFDGWVK